MALPRTTVQVVLNGGLDTKTDPKRVVAGKLLTLENGYQLRIDEIRKRFGGTSLRTNIAGGGNVSSGRKLSTFGDELVLTSANSIYSWSEASESWVLKGSSSAFTAKTRPVVANGYEQTNQDAAFGSGLAVFAWEDGRGGVRYAVLDYATGQYVVPDASLHATGIRPRVICIDSTFYLFYTVLASTSLFVKKIGASTPTTISAASTVATDTHATLPYFDVAVKSPNMLVAYRRATDIKLLVLTNAMTVATSPIATAHTLDTSLCLSWLHHDFLDGYAYLASSGGTDGVQVSTFSLTTFGLVAREVVEAAVVTANQITGWYDGTSKTLLYQVPAATTYNTKVRKGVYAGSATLSDFARSAGLASKAFKVGTGYFVNLVYDSTLQATYFTANSSGELLAKSLYGTGGGLTAKDSQLAGAWAVDSEKVIVPTLRKTRLISENATLFTQKGVNYLVLDYNDTKLGPPRRFGEALYFPGGFLRAYDGNCVVEHGFHLHPEQPTLTPSNGAGALTNSGVYQYKIVWTWIDGKGQTHRSKPSVAKTVTMGGTDDTVAVTIPTLRLTAKKGTVVNVVAEVYRTENAGSTFYKVSSTTSPTFNSAAADTVSFTDLLADSAIISNEILYTNGDVLENLSPPPCRVLGVYKNRFWLAGLEDGAKVIHSKELVAGEAPGFSDAYELKFDGEEGDINSIGEMDDKIVFCTRNAPYFTAGEGPNDQGDGIFHKPQRVSTDVGSEEPESIARTAEGLMYKSTKGIYLLDRGLGSSYIGAPVEGFNTLNVTGALVMSDLNQVRLTTAEGTTLVYDTFFKQWGVFTGQAAVSCVSWQNQFAYLSEEGVVRVEVPDQYNDDGAPIATKLKTSWLRVAQFQRVIELQILGEFMASHRLKISVAYDFADAIREEKTIDPEALDDDGYYIANPYGHSSYGLDQGYGTTYADGEDGVYRFVYKLPVQKCTAVQFTIEDVYPDNEGTQGLRITELALLVAPKPGLASVGQHRRL